MTRFWGTWLGRCLLPVAACASLVACGGGSGSNPKTLSVSGLKIPTSQIVGAVKSMCGVASGAHTDPVAANAAYYGGPSSSLHQLASVLGSGHATQSKALLSAIQGLEADLAATPPAASAGSDADLVVSAAKDGLTALKVTPPTC